jgi:uncharacterized protein (TIGR02118 family)
MISSSAKYGGLLTITPDVLPRPCLPWEPGRPINIKVFEKLYQDEHVPMVRDKLAGKTKFIATKVMATPDGTPPPFCRIAEVYFPSLEALQACA